MLRRMLGVLTALVMTMAGGAMAASSQYDPHETFAPLVMPQPVNRYRSADGTPGPDYWQNVADYEIHATLDTERHSLSASETITYTNNSPDALDSVWLQLDQNVYRKNSRGVFAAGGSRGGSTDGFILDAVEVEAGGKTAKAEFVVTDTRMQVRLPRALHSNGGMLKLHVRYHFEIPGEFGGRMGWADYDSGAIYDLAQWYPRMAVYDDLRGWDTAPYLAQEFYLEYGRFDYYVTVPADMLVAGSGELVNGKDVLTRLERERLDAARKSDTTVMIRSPEEVTDPASRPQQGGTLTWHYRMKNTRDVAFSASASFVWDAARMNLPGGKTALAMSFYPPQSAGEEAWGRSTEYLKHAVETFSNSWYPYPWPAAVNVAGPASGMEYPGLLFDGIPLKGGPLFWITAHEIGHTWFPMIVGFDERRNAWMDEGFNTFIDVYESDAFENGVYGPKRDGEYAPGGGNPVDEILPILSDPDAPPIMSRADTVIEKYRHPVTYFKSALGLVLLREQILGPDRFDYAFRRFIRNWAFRHPTPSDFFRAMESAAGEDLGWWWRGWYMHQWPLDLAVTDVAYTGGDPAKGAQVKVRALGKLVMPATLRVTFADGASRDIRMPVESWIRAQTATVEVDGGGPIASVTLDPDHAIPDADRTNNVFTLKRGK